MSHGPSTIAERAGVRVAVRHGRTGSLATVGTVVYEDDGGDLVLRIRTSEVRIPRATIVNVYTFPTR